MKIIFGDLLPGETPIDDVSGLKIPEISTRGQLSLAEAANIRKVFVKYFGNTPTPEIATFDLDWAKSLHGEMYGDVWEWAGQLRTRDLNLGCSWTQIQDRLHNLFEDLKYWKDNGVETIEQAVRLHHGAVWIHPFANGNGRWARTLSNIWLAMNAHMDVRWPDDLIGAISPIRDNYIGALKAADNGDFDPLLQMHQAYLRPE